MKNFLEDFAIALVITGCIAGPFLIGFYNMKP